MKGGRGEGKRCVYEHACIQTCTHTSIHFLTSRREKSVACACITFAHACISYSCRGMSACSCISRLVVSQVLRDAPRSAARTFEGKACPPNRVRSSNLQWHQGSTKASTTLCRGSGALPCCARPVRAPARNLGLHHEEAERHPCGLLRAP